MRIALIALGVSAFLAVDGYLLWAFAGPGKKRRLRGGAVFVRACQALGAVLILAGLAAIAGRIGGVISDHWLAAHWTCSDGTEFEHRACNPHEAAGAVWALAGGAILVGWLGTLAPAMRAASRPSVAG